MREILFRGKRTGTHEWVSGFIGKRPSSIQIGNYSPWFIHVPPADPDDSGGFYNVIPESIGQYTGLKDKNGKMIFEGDVLASESCFRKKAIGHIVFGTPSFDPNVETEEPAFGVKWRYEDRGMRTDLNYWASISEVIGNIHDNPELIGG